MFLGLDLGTSGVRALLVDANGGVIGSAEATYSVTRPHPGWSEQDPAEWLAACRDTFLELRKSNAQAYKAIRGIGVAGHMHGATLLDRHDKVLRPCILWNDTRSHEQAARLDAQADVRALSGNIVFPGFTAPKLLWVAEKEPEIFAQTAKVLLPKDYVGLWLTGKHVSDMSDSAGTAWLDVKERRWSQALLGASGMRQDQMPDLVEGSEIAGTLRADLAAELGLSEAVSIVGGAGDNAAAACGAGALKEGDGFVSLGTSGVLLAAKDNFFPSPASAVHTFCHAIPDTWYQMGVILSATDSLNWLSRNLGVGAAELAGNLGNKINGPSGIQFLPYLSGERTPHNDSAIRGAFLGLDVSLGHNELTQSVLEGVSFALRDSLEALKSTGTRFDSLMALGGGAQSPYWVELIATVLDLPVTLPEQGEFGAALGAARLAICGVTGATPDEIMTKPAIKYTIQPRAELRSAYDASYQTFRRAYPAVKGLL
ncbi:MAG: xylulokinase [Paracoccaceae bacterium]